MELEKDKVQGKTTCKWASTGLVLAALAAISFVFFVLLRIEFLAIVSSITIATIIASHFIAYYSLQSTELDIEFDSKRSRVGEPSLVKVYAINNSAVFPFYYPSIQLKEPDRNAKQSFHLPVSIPPHTKRLIEIDPFIHNRGRQTLEIISIRTRFPFGIFESERTVSFTSPPTIIWPRSVNIKVKQELKRLEKKQGVTESHSRTPNRTPSITRMRDYLHGDPIRHINWKISAKRDKTTVIDPDNEERSAWLLAINTSRRLWKNQAHFEQMLRFASCLVPEFQKERRLSGVLLDGHFHRAQSSDQLRSFLDTLSLCEMSDLEPNFSTTSGRVAWILPDETGKIKLMQSPPDLPEKNAKPQT